jgi:GNAT superfamily N-acetyltransferase
MDDLAAVFKGSWGITCWCMHPRLTYPEIKVLPGEGKLKPRRRAAMTALAAQPIAPGLIASESDDPVGWVSIAPRDNFHRVDRSRATPREDDVAVWVIPCVTVAKRVRGEGVAIALIKAAVADAAENGAPSVEAYLQAGENRTSDDSAYFGTEPLFRQAGFTIIPKPLDKMPKNWPPRVTMRLTPN